MNKQELKEALREMEAEDEAIAEAAKAELARRKKEKKKRDFRRGLIFLGIIAIIVTSCIKAGT